MALSISDHCRSCIVSLQEVISILSQPDRSDNHVKPSQVCEELDRFSLFIGNIGALHRPESPLSIESRLRDANDVLTHILGLLTDLNDVTTELLDIVSGKREGMVTIADEAEEDGEVISEANELREEISETITRLFRVSILIRQAAPTDIFAKALSRNRYHFSDQFDIAHVGEKYRKLATEDYAWLRQRLGRAITQRRHYLSYIHDHREKLGGTLKHHDKTDGLAAKPQAPVIKQPLDPKPMLDAESRPSFFTKATTVAAERITPQLHVAGDSDPDEDARSYTTVSRSIDGDHESSTNVRIPKLDTLRADHKNEFECPFCFRIKKFKSERIWRKHVFSDLRPYVCTFPDCDAPYFGDINKWFHHEMTLHRVTYNCFLCQKVYYQEGKYLSHLRQEHGDTLDDGGAQIGTELARKPLAQIPASDCPCCSDWADRLEEQIIHTSGSAPTGILAVTPTVFKRHLAAHLEQLALFAVPIVATTDDNKDSNAAIEEARSKRTNTSQVSALTFPSLPGDFDNSSSETEMDPSRNPISRTDTQSTEINREHINPSSNVIPKTPSLPSDTSKRRGLDSAIHYELQIGLELGHRNRVEGCKLAHGDDHSNTLASRTALAFHWQEYEQWIKAEEELYHVMEITKRKLGDNHPNTLDSMKNLAACYEKQKKWELANELLVQVMEISETTLSHDHPDTLDSIKNLASNYVAQGRQQEADVLLARALKIFETKSRQNHYDTIAITSELAPALSRQERWDEAEATYRELISAYTEVIGRSHETTLVTIEELVRVLQQQGALEEAIVLQREALAGFEKLFGPEGRNTLASKEQLASILEDLKEYDEAEVLQREVLEGYGHVSWPTLTQVLTSKERLASILGGQGKYGEAEAVQREVPLQYEYSFGPEDTQTLTSKERLALILVNNGKYDEAEALQREVLTGYQNVLGSEDRQTLLSMKTLAWMLKKSGKLEEAEPVRRNILAVSERVFGIDDLRTIQVIDDLAMLQRDLGRLNEEEALRREAVRRYRKAVGSEHSETHSALLRLADALSKNAKFEEAEGLFREAIRRYSEQFGPDHMLTRSTINDFELLFAEQGKFKEAEDVRREEVMALERKCGRYDPKTLTSLSTLASLLERHGKLEEAEDFFREVFERGVGSDGTYLSHVPYSDTMANMHALASVQEKQEKFEAAESTYRQMLAMLISWDRGLFAEEILDVTNELLRVLEMQGKDEEADDMRRQLSEAQDVLSS